MKWNTLLLVARSFILSMASAFPGTLGLGTGGGLTFDARRFLSGFRSGSASSTAKRTERPKSVIKGEGTHALGQMSFSLNKSDRIVPTFCPRFVEKHVSKMRGEPRQSPTLTLFIFNVFPGEEESHHSGIESVSELYGQRHHIDFKMLLHRYSSNCKKDAVAVNPQQSPVFCSTSYEEIQGVFCTWRLEFAQNSKGHIPCWMSFSQILYSQHFLK